MGKTTQNVHGHLVDVLIFFKSKISLSIVKLEIWWDVAKHPNTPFRQIWWGWWVLAGNLQIPPKSLFFVLLDLPPQAVSTFLIIIAKVTHLPTFLCAKFVSNVLRFCLTDPEIPSVTLLLNPFRSWEAQMFAGHCIGWRGR